MGTLFLVSTLLARNATLPLAGGQTTMRSMHMTVTRAVLSLILLITALPALFATTSITVKAIFLLSAMMTLMGTVMNFSVLLEEWRGQRAEVDADTPSGLSQIGSSLKQICVSTCKGMPQLAKAILAKIQGQGQRNAPSGLERWLHRVRVAGGGALENMRNLTEGRSTRLDTDGKNSLGLFFLGQNPVTPLGGTPVEGLLDQLE
ncbi:hypothetical protein HAT2_00706 [Candidatus Similichlamydia laticola]|uniref:Uncharacterized protein n=1 Tax=Candidatus Similichlamydia laticola TaxID=2170265 RepID=A0A369KJS2_9BACT|nr:hypothetical protein HAT2_00706 [Candidatus Similichlamydia laticola]